MATQNKDYLMEIHTGLSDSLEMQMSALPEKFNKQRFLQNCMTVLQDGKSDFSKCDAKTVVRTLLKGAFLGLDFFNGECYAIPYGTSCQFQTDYKGEIKLCKRYSKNPIKDIYAKVVREGDEFEEVIENGRQTVNFKPKSFNDGEIIGAFAIVLYQDGSMMYDTMSRAEIEHTRQVFSKAADSKAWKEAYGEMCKKGLYIGTPILTDDGFKPMLDIEVGDVVFDMYGSKTDVIAVSEIKNIDCYEVIFSDGERLVCDDEHRWVAKTGKHADRKGWETYTVNDLYDLKKSGVSISIPVCDSVQFDEQDLTIPPYVLGYWLGNGSSYNANITCDVKDAEEICSLIKNRSFGKYGIGGSSRKENSNAITYGVINGLKADLRNEGLLGNKHIPHKYFVSSKEQRMDLIRGLMDSDGCMEKDRGKAIFTTTDLRLAINVHQIVSSLGEKANINSTMQSGFGKTVMCFYVEWKPITCPVYLKRKANNYKPRKLRVYRSVKEINKIDSMPTKCIAVNSYTKTYLAGYGCIPTHNTVLRRLCKLIDLDFDTAEQCQAFEDGSDFDVKEKPREKYKAKNVYENEIIDGECTEVEEKQMTLPTDVASERQQSEDHKAE